MIGTYLVQRLSAPPKSELHAKAEQVFGGGMLGLSKDGWKMLQQVFGIEYMGAAEYEFGTIPRCLKEMADDRANLVAVEVLVKAEDIAPNWNRKRTAYTKARKTKKKQPVHPPVKDQTVYLLCRKDDVEGVIESIRGLAGGKTHTKMGHNVDRALDPIGEDYLDTKGWLELDNGFFFFLDKTMWENTCRMFDVPVPTQGA